MLAGRQISAVNAMTRWLITNRRVPIALTGPAVGEGPESGLALVTLAPSDSPFATLTLARVLVTSVRQRS
jgi:hypothetical protein